MTTVNRPVLYFRRPAEQAAPAHPLACYHGGAFFEAIGKTFDDLGRRHDVINADVLDAWFPPAPGVIAALTEHLEWSLRTSPPTQCEGLIDAIADARGLPRDTIVVGAGSSDLIYRAFPRWLSARSSVLLLDPTYGEYQHVLGQVVGCRINRFALDAARDYHVDLTELGARIRADRPDMVVLVNPNTPTGQHIERPALEAFLRHMPERTRFWIDEAYLDYIDPGESLESFAATTTNVVVCKSMSKVYALSGVRAAYLCAAEATAAELRRVTPPWAVGLPGQIAGVRALADPRYYRARYDETHALRQTLAAQLADLGFSVLEGAANSVLCTMPNDAMPAADLVARARQRGLFIRDISSMTAQRSERVFRVAVKSAASNATIGQILGELIGG